MRAEFCNDRVLYIIQSGWGNDTVPNAHVLAEDKSDGTQDNSSEKIERVFCQFPKYQLLEVSIRNFIAKVRKEDFFFFKLWE
jgi:hypothetical protein